MIRDQLADALDWHEAHATLADAVDGLAPELRGRRPPGFPHSAWELLEHLRLTQRDLLEFCRNPAYRAPKWPDDYWPPSGAPPEARAWDESIANYRHDCSAFQALVRDPSINLEARIPHGEGQTYLREVLLAIDHAGYHIGQLVAVRRALGAWK
jgi:DinB superfamily